IPSPTELPVGGSEGLFVVLSVRPVSETGAADVALPAGTRSVSVFVVNRRRAAADEVRDAAFAFQVELELECDADLVRRVNPRGMGSTDWDERVADLQYREACEYAVGHGVATVALPVAGDRCRRIRTAWIPAAEVERVAPTALAGVELSMEALAGVRDFAHAQDRLGALAAEYRGWIEK